MNRYIDLNYVRNSNDDVKLHTLLKYHLKYILMDLFFDNYIYFDFVRNFVIHIDGRERNSAHWTVVTNDVYIPKVEHRIFCSNLKLND